MTQPIPETSEIYRRLGIARGDRRIDWVWMTVGIIAALLLYLWRLGNLPLRDWDEGIVATVARQIWRSPWTANVWLFPQNLDATPYFNKPPLMHWLVALSYHIGGVSEWTTRLPGALLSALSVPLLYCLGRELFYRRLPALFAMGVYLTYLPMVRQGRLAMLDGAIVCFWLVTLFCLLRSRRDGRWSLGFGVGIALMCLTKGLVGVLLGILALVFLVWDTPRILRSGYFWGGLLLGILPVGAWYGCQYQHYGPVFIQAHFFDQSLARIAQPVEQNTGPVWFYLLEILKYGGVWVPFLALGLRLCWRDRALSWVRLVVVWLSGYFSFISLMQTKLPWYAMPLYPAIALLLGVVLTSLWEPTRWWRDRGIRLAYYQVWGTVMGLFLLLVAIIFAYYVSIDAKWSLILTLGTLTATLTATTILAWRQSRQFILILIWGTYLTLLALMGSPHWVWELAEQEPVRPIAALLRRHTPISQPVYALTDRLNRPSLTFYSDRVLYPVTTDDLVKQLQTKSDRHPLSVILPTQQWAEFSPQLKPHPTKVIAKTDRWQIITINSTAPNNAAPNAAPEASPDNAIGQ
jgi:4-amino-4-deoxy-L-arabinose transferase-like glycosyltransferase